MLVSHRKRFIYTKTGKTGGTSVEVYFEPFCMNDGEWTLCERRPEYVSDAGIIGCRGGLAFRKDAKWWNHMPAATLKSYLGDDLWNAYFKFCVVRNPFDRAVSAFHFFCVRKARNLTDPNAAAPAAPPPPPGPPQSLPELRQSFESWLAAGQMGLDRDKYVIDGQFCLDDVIRYESMTADLERISRRLDVPFRPDQLPRLKSGFRPDIPLKDYYTPRSIDIVAHTHQYELDHFGYAVPF